MIERKLDSIIARFFSESSVRSIMKDRDSSNSLIREFQSLMSKSGLHFEGETYQDLFEFAYKYLLQNYRNEYIYKNAIANRILLGIHSLNTSFMLQEFRVGSCKVDTVVLNGTSNAYEIKTELDSLERLSKQVDTYLKVFDMVHVITYPGHADKVRKVIPERVGLLELVKGEHIKTLRKAISGKDSISTEVLFDSLRRSEYQAIVKEHYGFAPIVPNTKAYSVYKELFTKIEPAVAHDLAVVHLKKRGNSVLLKDFIGTVPEFFKSLSVSGRFSSKDMAQVQAMLQSKLTFA